METGILKSLLSFSPKNLRKTHSEDYTPSPLENLEWIFTCSILDFLHSFVKIFITKFFGNKSRLMQEIILRFTVIYLGVIQMTK